MAAHLLATPTITDGVWTSEPRLPRETRSDFVRSVLLGETPESEPETPGDPLGRARRTADALLASARRTPSHVPMPVAIPVVASTLVERCDRKGLPRTLNRDPDPAVLSSLEGVELGPATW